MSRAADNERSADLLGACWRARARRGRRGRCGAGRRHLALGRSAGSARPSTLERSRGPRPRPARLRRPALGHRLLHHGRPGRFRRSGRARGRDGAGGAGGPVCRAGRGCAPRRSPAPLDLRRPGRAGRRRAARARRRRPRRRRLRCRASPIARAPRPASAAPRSSLVTSAGLRRRICAHQPLDLRHRAGRQRHRDAARLRLFQRRASGRSGRPGGDRPRAGERAVARLNPARPATAQAAGGLRPARRPAGWSAIWPARSTAPRSRAAPAS